MSLNYLSFAPTNGQPPQGLLVILHGWGSNAQDVANVTPLLDLPDYQIICVDAPFAHYQVPGGRSWYALEREDYQGLEESRQILQDWLTTQEANTGVPLEKTILAGFSQGGAMTLDRGLGLPLQGLCVLSGYLHSQIEVKDYPPPVLIIHGKQDLVVPIAIAQRAKDELTQLGVNIEYHELNIGHEIVPRVMKLMHNFIRQGS